MSITFTTGAPPKIGTVAYEAERLDRLFPGWYERVNVEELSLPTMRSCVLGQSEGSFMSAWPLVRADAVGEGANPVTLYCEPRYEYDWINEIRRRLFR